PRHLFVALLLITAVGVALVAVAATRASAGPAADAIPADEFMAAVAARDGVRGWQQLCPGAQDEMPLAEMVQESEALRAMDSVSGTQIDMRFVRAQPLVEGGERRTYIATAQASGAERIHKTFVVRTEAGGCVEGLE